MPRTRAARRVAGSISRSPTSAPSPTIRLPPTADPAPAPRTTPSASTSQGKVNVAAAVAITLSTVHAETILGPAITVTAGTAVALKTSANTDASSNANGSASQGATATIGAAVALTLANVTNRAQVPAGVTIHAHDLTVAATVTTDGADTTSTYGAQSIAGAGGGKISVAGSVAIAVVNQATTAGVYGTVVLTGGDATLTAGSTAATTVKALPAGEGVTSTGPARARGIRRPRIDHRRHDRGDRRRGIAHRRT